MQHASSTGGGSNAMLFGGGRTRRFLIFLFAYGFVAVAFFISKITIPILHKQG